MEIIKDHKIGKSLNNERFVDTTYEELTITGSKIQNCEFSNVRFKHCSLGSNTHYTNCKFINCKIEGAYSTLGNPSTYSKCTFENCNFIGRMVFMGAIFEDCILSGAFTNNVIIDEKRWFKKYYTFTNCDLTNAKFDNLTVNGDRTFKNCQLPEKS